MSSPNKNWYGHLVAQSRNDNIYTLIHQFLEPTWEPNHELDFVAVRRSQLPQHLKNIPPKHISEKLPFEKYCFPASDYLLLHNYQLTEYLHAAKWAKVVEDFEHRSFIELRYNWTDEAEATWNNPPAYPMYGAEKIQVQPTMSILHQPPQTEQESALIESYGLLKKGYNKKQALAFAETGKSFLDEQQITVTEDPNNALQQIARRMMGYNIVAMVYVWNNKIDKAGAVDKYYIHQPLLWIYLDGYIQPYLELLMVKRQKDYLKHLFSDKAFRQRFLGHYAAYISLFVDDTYTLTGGEVVSIINRVNNTSDAYK